MKEFKRLKMLGFFVGVIALSMATNLTTNYLANKSENNHESQSVQVPATYAKFANASNAMETDFTVAAELSIHAVVHVKTKTPMKNQMFGGGGMNDPFFEYFFGRPQQRQPQEMPMQEASGSGVIISNDGYIVTNNHVVEDAKEIEVTLNDNRSFKAKLVGADPNTDIALIKVDAKDLPVILFGNSDSLKVGEWVLAVGNPFNLTSTVTAGIVSAKGRSIGINKSKMPIESFIQTDAAVNPGNSGGALVNTRGELVGINTAIASQTGSYAGYAFAVPVSIVQKVVADIRQYGIVQRALLGVQMGAITDEVAKDKKLKTMEGAYVDKVVENSAADKAGIKAGDVIVKVENEDIKSPSQLQEQIGRYSPGDKVSITVLRDNKPVVVKAELKNSVGSTAVVSSNNNIDMLGAEFKALDEKTMDKFNLPYGVEIKSLKKGKLQEAGIKAGFIIVKINNQAIREVDDIESALDDSMNGDDRFKTFNIVGLYPNGKMAAYAINLTDN